MEKTRIRVDIMGRGFNLVSGEKGKYLENVAKEVDRRMKEFKTGNPRLDYDTAAVLTALNLCDELMSGKAEKEDDETNLIRSQLVEYSKELSKATNTIKKLEKEIDAIKSASKKKEESLKREYAAKEKEILDMIEAN